MNATLVMKFGGAAVASPEKFSEIADIILARQQAYRHIVIVVSAMGDTTDQLIALAKKVNPHPPKREYDMLVTVGERISISLLAMALAAKQREAISFTGSQSGIITSARHTEAAIVDVRPHRIIKGLEANKIVIVAGFQGVSQSGDITTLGRGGSDTTAVALGVALKADKVEFYKDVPGIFEQDPKHHPHAALLPSLSYELALQIVNQGAKVLHSRCIQLAWKNNLPLHVRSFQNFSSAKSPGTVIMQIGQACNPTPIYEEHDLECQEVIV